MNNCVIKLYNGTIVSTEASVEAIKKLQLSNLDEKRQLDNALLEKHRDIVRMISSRLPQVGINNILTSSILYPYNEEKSQENLQLIIAGWVDKALTEGSFKYSVAKNIYFNSIDELIESVINTKGLNRSLIDKYLIDIIKYNPTQLEGQQLDSYLDSKQDLTNSDKRALRTAASAFEDIKIYLNIGAKNIGIHSKSILVGIQTFSSNPQYITEVDKVQNGILTRINETIASVKDNLIALKDTVGFKEIKPKLEKRLLKLSIQKKSIENALLQFRNNDALGRYIQTGLKVWQENFTRQRPYYINNDQFGWDYSNDTQFQQIINGEKKALLISRKTKEYLETISAIQGLDNLEETVIYVEDNNTTSPTFSASGWIRVKGVQEQIYQDVTDELKAKLNIKDDESLEYIKKRIQNLKGKPVYLLDIEYLIPEVKTDDRGLLSVNKLLHLKKYKSINIELSKNTQSNASNERLYTEPQGTKKSAIVFNKNTLSLNIALLKKFFLNKKQYGYLTISNEVRLPETSIIDFNQYLSYIVAYHNKRYELEKQNTLDESTINKALEDYINNEIIVEFNQPINLEDTSNLTLVRDNNILYGIDNDNSVYTLRHSFPVDISKEVPYETLLKITDANTTIPIEIPVEIGQFILLYNEDNEVYAKVTDIIKKGTIYNIKVTPQNYLVELVSDNKLSKLILAKANISVANTIKIKRNENKVVNKYSLNRIQINMNQNFQSLFLYKLYNDDIYKVLKTAIEEERYNIQINASLGQSSELIRITNEIYNRVMNSPVFNALEKDLQDFLSVDIKEYLEDFTTLHC